MSGRVCLLCEKPLGRSWLGAGEDFCSREHRNQYRLRRGMDRLLEANKVANLMRRRESPKPIVLFREIAETDIPRHGFFDVPFSAGDGEPMAPRNWREVGDILEPTSLDGADFFADARPRQQSHPLPSPLSAEAPRLAERPGPPVFPPSPKQPYARVRPAGPATAHDPGSEGRRVRRDMGILWKSSLLLHLDPNHHVAAGSFHPYEEPHGCREVDLTSPRGYSLRVCLAAGFRIQQTRLREVRMDLPQPEVPESRGPRELSADLYEGRREQQREPAPPPVRTRQALPELSWKDPEARMEWPGILSPSSVVPLEGPELPVRPLNGVFTGFPPSFPPPTPHGGKDRARLRRPRLIPAGDPPEARVEEVPIGSADGVDSRPGAPHESRSSVEERFDSGWKNWQGGFNTWTVDAAGARTGNLALFTPSMEWRDYEMEFFTRIESRSVSFVYRALSLNDYYMATLAALPGKGYTFTRRTVLRGKPGAALTSPLTILPNPKSAYLVRLRIAGNQFTLSIDGQKIETWTDNRFSMGGAGFLGATDDRARIYWVRFYPGPAKESQRK